MECEFGGLKIPVSAVRFCPSAPLISKAYGNHRELFCFKSEFSPLPVPHFIKKH